MANFYERLGVARGASDEVIRSAYRALARKCHPDLHGQSSPQVQAANSRKMAEISEAYEVLSHPSARAAYDRELDGYGYSDSSYSSSRPPPPPQWPRPNADQCEYCGSGPAKRVRLRRNVGLLLTRRRFGGDITLCRSCGLALFRQFQNSTLAKGWWGPISFFINIGCVLGNSFAWLLIATLDEPSPPLSPVDVPLSHPMPKGPLLIQRAGVWIAVVLFFFLASKIDGNDAQIPQVPAFDYSYVTTTTSVPDTPVTPYPVAGECVAARGKFITKIVNCASPHFAVILKLAKSPEQCPKFTDKYFVETDSEHDPGKTVCLSTLG